MDEPRIGFCRDAARALLRKHAVRRPPIDVHAIANAEGVSVAETDLGDADGRARRVDGEWLIEISSKRARVAQRFTVGHEIGHIRLGHESCGGDTLAERQANVFAAELLMPLAMLKTALKNISGLGPLADLFGVSKEAMRIKLDEQGLLMKLTSFD